MASYPDSGSPIQGAVRRMRRTPGRDQDLWQVLSLPLLAFLVLPLVALLLRTSPSRLVENLASPQVRQAILVSLQTSLAATGLIILLGTPLAFSLAGGSGSRAGRLVRRVVDTLIDLPLVLPPAVAGVALLIAFGRRGLFGAWLADIGLQIAFTKTAVVLAQVFIASPFYVKTAALAFASLEPELEQAAALDGANRWQTFRYVFIPLSWASLLSGSMMSWARALGEFGATLIFAGNFPGRTQTMPLAIFIGFELDLDIALTLSVILAAFSFLVLLLVKGVLSRSDIQERNSW